VAHQLLHHLDILPIGFEQRGVHVPKGVEAYPFRDSGPLLLAKTQSSSSAKAVSRFHADSSMVVNKHVAGLI